jgi:hypothetical protein
MHKLLGHFVRVAMTTEVLLVEHVAGKRALLRDDLGNRITVPAAELEPVGVDVALAHFSACDRVHHLGEPSAVAAALATIQHKEAA